jgi:hypothetical protein
LRAEGEAIQHAGAVITSEAKQSRLQCRFWIASRWRSSQNGTVIASEAKQSRLQRGFWIAWSLRRSQ